MLGNLGVEVRIEELACVRRWSACILALIMVNIYLLSSQPHGVTFWAVSAFTLGDNYDNITNGLFRVLQRCNCKYTIDSGKNLRIPQETSARPYSGQKACFLK